MAITQAQYLDSAIKLLPMGLAWKRVLDGNLAKILAVRCDQLVDVNATAHELVYERIPGQATLLLEEWEEYFGLPECGRKVAGKSLTERQAQVKQKEDEVGSNSKLFLEDVAAKAGFKIRVVNHFPHHCLRDCTYPLFEQTNAWRIFIYTHTPSIRYATCLDDVLHRIVLIERNQELECLLKRYAYSHLQFVFVYKTEEDL
ncbi:putative phage tail protein [Testudinibacter sp. P27/CKL/0425]